MRKIDVGIGTITFLAFSPDGSQLAIAGDRGVAIGSWPELLRQQSPFAIRSSPERVAQIAWHPDSYTFAVAMLDSAVQIWNRRLRRPRELMDLEGQEGCMLSVAFSPDGLELAMGGGWLARGTALVVDTYKWRPLRHFEAGDQIGSILYVRQHVLATGSADKSIAVYDFSKREETAGTYMLASPVQSLDMQNGGQRLAVAAGNQVQLLPITDEGALLPPSRLECRGHKYVVKAIDYSPDGRLLASTGEDGTLRFWNADTAAAVASLDLGIGKLRAVAFAPDGLTALAGGDAGTIAIVDVDY